MAQPKMSSRPTDTSEKRAGLAALPVRARRCPGALTAGWKATARVPTKLKTALATSGAAVPESVPSKATRAGPATNVSSCSVESIA